MRNIHTLLLIITTTIVIKAAEGEITCTAVSTRYDSTVTCSFGVAISQTKHNFNVQFYYPDITAGADTILMCNWLAAGNLKCKAGRDIRFNNVITDKVVIKGPPRQQSGGVYVCQVVPRLDAAVIPCNLTYQDVTTVGTTTKEPRKEDQLEEIRQATNSLLILGVITATLLCLIIIFVIIALVIFQKRIMQQIREMGGQDQSQKPTEGPGMDAEVGMEMSEHTAPLLGNANPDRDQNPRKLDSWENVRYEDTAAAMERDDVPKQHKKKLKDRIVQAFKPSSRGSKKDNVTQQADTDPERSHSQRVSERESVPTREPRKAEVEHLLPQHQQQQRQQHPQPPDHMNRNPAQAPEQTLPKETKKEKEAREKKEKKEREEQEKKEKKEREEQEKKEKKEREEQKRQSKK